MFHTSVWCIGGGERAAFVVCCRCADVVDALITQTISCGVIPSHFFPLLSCFPIPIFLFPHAMQTGASLWKGGHISAMFFNKLCCFFQWTYQTAGHNGKLVGKLVNGSKCVWHPLNAGDLAGLIVSGERVGSFRPPSSVMHNSRAAKFRSVNCGW